MSSNTTPGEYNVIIPHAVLCISLKPHQDNVAMSSTATPTNSTSTVNLEDEHSVIYASVLIPGYGDPVRDAAIVISSETKKVVFVGPKHLFRHRSHHALISPCLFCSPAYGTAMSIS